MINAAISARPPRLKVPDDVVTDFLEVMRKTECFEAKDVEWVESILTRPDHSDGYAQLTSPFVFSRQDQAENLYAVCKSFNEQRDKLTAVELHDARMVLSRILWSKRVSMYKQQKVIVALPQRKQHPKYPAPNLENWEGAGQHASAQMLAVYGLEYVAARVQCVKQALADVDATHLFFVDDDVLIPKDALRTLLSYGLPSVAGIYVKKTPALQTNTTTSGEHPELIYSQQLVDPKVGDMTPVPTSCVGGGMWLMSLDLFRKIPEPWFEMLRAPDGKVVVGEDSTWCQKLAAYGVTTYAIPGVIGVHCDFATGDQYAPHEIVDPTTRRIRPEWKEKYQAWPEGLNTMELVAGDVVDYFGKNAAMKAAGVLK